MNAVEQSEVDATTSKVISCAYRVSNTLGAGFLEKVYENALAVELRYSGPQFTQQIGCPVALLLNFGAPRLEMKRFVWGF